ncbi:glycosyltransferase family 2 protein [Arenibaculum sp.]|uniref:glycosyltransferase family 2 protein n=1 Tax=Arenibaculum sp. TaxID=2865862 RepID=UPI002E14148A|nr:glycosyltransferase family 2 protein [Arenibaculum sp.]
MSGPSILIPALDEAANLPGCLASVAWCDDVVVLDSLSSDRTAEIALAAGARVVRRRLDDWSSQQNWALANIGFRHPWVFHLDADERVPPELASELRETAAAAGPELAAFYCGRNNRFMGAPVPHAMPPVPVMRLYRPGRIRFERLVHPVPVVDGRWGHLRSRIEHDTSSKGIIEWVERHARYAQLEASEGAAAREGVPRGGPSLLSRDRALRRRALKALSARLPFRPLLKFAYMYLVGRGFLDGRAGLAYCVLQAFYEYMIVLRTREMRAARRPE